jgi:hypothetical protein
MTFVSDGHFPEDLSSVEFREKTFAKLDLLFVKQHLPDWCGYFPIGTAYEVFFPL